MHGSSARDYSADFMKFFLVAGMTVAHVIQLLTVQQDASIAWHVSNYVNLVSFSGFMFCMGYVNQTAYFSKEKDIVAARLTSNFKSIMLAYYISGLAHLLLIAREYRVVSIVRVLLLIDIPNYSEFLLSFAFLNILVLVFFNQIRFALSKKHLVLSLIVLCLALTYIPYEAITFNPLGILLGTKSFYAFPVIQYMPYYLAGAYISRHRPVNIRALLLTGLLLSSPAINNYLAFGFLPSRFPPDIFWITGGSLFIILYHVTAQKLSWLHTKLPFVTFTGRHTLDFLLFSNIIFFTLNFTLGRRPHGIIWCLSMTLLVIVFAALIIKIKLFIKSKLFRNRVPADKSSSHHD